MKKAGSLHKPPPPPKEPATACSPPRSHPGVARPTRRLSSSRAGATRGLASPCALAPTVYALLRLRYTPPTVGYCTPPTKLCLLHASPTMYLSPRDQYIVGYIVRRLLNSAYKYIIRRLLNYACCIRPLRYWDKYCGTGAGTAAHRPALWPPQCRPLASHRPVLQRPQRGPVCTEHIACMILQA